MTIRLVLTTAVAAVVLVACGSGDSDGADTTLPDVTLLTTTSQAALIEDGDADDAPTVDAPDDSAPITEATVATTVAEAETTTTVTTTVAPDTVPASTAPPVVETTPPDTAPAPIEGGFVLDSNGLGAVPFGADPEQTITFVTSMVGAPTRDTGWLAPIEIGPCGGTRIRQVSWNQLQLEFGDVSDVVQGRDHFYAYFYGIEGSSTPEPAGLRTAENVGAGSSVADLLAAYPGATLFQGDEFTGPSFSINANLAGRVSGVADSDVVEAIIGGRPCDG